MHLERYDFEKDPENLHYEFFSIGPKGKIKKVVEFRRMYSHIYNLAFGDWYYLEKRIDDTIITNNNDRDKVLATVANVVISFMKDHPKAILLAEGSTQSRNRLYRMGIAKFWGEIIQHYDINGLTDCGWEYYQKGRNYEAFLLKLKLNLNH